jgi:hypothetical protein
LKLKCRLIALNDFKVDYINRYEDILNKTLVGLKVANTRFEPNLSYGDTVVRAILDMSGVRVRAFTNLNDQTIDPLTDSEETMTVNVQVGAVFPIARLEKIQAGPLNPAMVAGKEAAMKVATYLDSVILKETMNAALDFDNGDLTTVSSSGTPITLSSTTIPQMVTNTKAKLEAANISVTNPCWVLDPYSIAMIAQFPIGKDITSENTVFKNGFSGTLYGAEIYSSNNLTGEATLTFSGNSVNAETVTIGGVVFTGVTTIGSTAGNFLVSAADSTTAVTNLAGLINNPGVTSSTQVALSAADQIKITDTLGLTATATSATVLTIVGRGSSRLVLAEGQTNASWNKNMVHAYYGLKGAIDVAIQDKPTVEMREEPKQLTTNIFNNVVAAVKTFADGSRKFLDVLIAA